MARDHYNVQGSHTFFMVKFKRFSKYFQDHVQQCAVPYHWSKIDMYRNTCSHFLFFIFITVMHILYIMSKTLTIMFYTRKLGIIQC